MNLNNFFKDQRPAWGESLEWDEDEHNVNKILARADSLTTLALNHGFDEAATDIFDDAVDYIVASGK